MDKDEFMRRWPEIRPRVKQQWGRLTDEELNQVDGNAELLIGIIQERYEEPRKAIEVVLERLVTPAGTT